MYLKCFCGHFNLTLGLMVGVEVNPDGMILKKTGRRSQIKKKQLSFREIEKLSDLRGTKFKGALAKKSYSRSLVCF